MPHRILQPDQPGGDLQIEPVRRHSPLARRHMRSFSRPACTITVRAGSINSRQNPSNGPALNGSIRHSIVGVETCIKHKLGS